MKRLGQECPSHSSFGARSLRGVVFDFDSEGLQELNVLIADLQLRVAGQSSDHGTLIRLLAWAADANRRFEHQENVVAAIFDPGNHVSNLVRVGQRLVDGFAKFLH